MGSIWNGSSDTRSKRIRFYCQVVFKFSKFFRFTPFEYKAGIGKMPDQILYHHQTLIFKYISLIQALILSSFILYSYAEVFFGQATKVELSAALAMNSAWLAVSTAQWTFIFKFYRLGGMNLGNFILDLQFRLPQNPPLVSEIIYMTAVIGVTICPLLPYPYLVFASWYLPGTVHMLNSGADAIAEFLFGNSEMSYWLVRHGIYVIISGSMIDAMVHQAVMTPWLYSFLFTMNQYLESMLETRKHSNIKQVSSLWNKSNITSEFLKIQILYAVYHQIYSKTAASIGCNFIIALIYIIFLILSPAVLPGVIIFTFLVAGVLFFLGAFLLFNNQIASYIFLQNLISVNREASRKEFAHYEHKVWISMRPLSASILGVCSFETRGLILVIWADVVIMSVINLLLAF